MAALKRIVGLLLLAASAAILLGACKTPDGPSSIPWNTPTDWERRGGIGIPMPER